MFYDTTVFVIICLRAVFKNLLFMIPNKLIKQLFWRLCLPFFFISSVWCLLKGLNPIKSNLFLLSITTMMPMLMVKAHEIQDGLIEKTAIEFSEMGATEFLNFMDEFKKMSLGTYRATTKETYRLEYLRRYNKDIFYQIPMFGSK